MVSHSSSSLSLSRTSLASSSASHSSPPSSPDSATNISLTPRNHSVSPLCCTSPLLSSTPAIVPFSWEEKPGVLKKEIMQTAIHLDEHGYAGSSPHNAGDCKLDPPTSIITGAAYKISHKHARTSTGKDLPQIRPPPRLSHPGQLHPNTVEGGHEFMTHHHHRHPGDASGAAVGSRIMASLSFHRRRHHRSTPSLEDDPFWLAMVACTNQEDKGVPSPRRKGSKAILTHEVRGTDFLLGRRVQEDSVYFEECIPRQGASEMTRSTSRKVHSGGGQEKALNQSRRADDKEPLNSVQFSSRKVHNTHADAARHRDGEESEYSVQPTRSASKAFKTLSMARTELHGRCKSLWQQQGPPVVDISCSSRRAKSKGGADATKHKRRPDLFGCKSNHPLILNSRFA